MGRSGEKNIFYVCRTGHHTSILAAALHTGMLKDGSGDSVFGIRGFNKEKLKETGSPFWVGRDRQNANVYTFGIGRENLLLTRAANELLVLLGIDPDAWQIVDTSSDTSRLTIVGLTIKRLHLHTLSKVFFYLGAKKEISRLARRWSR